tara:strand:+ start:192 stop:500 length:309 start_codon:yes stop_codon:yes gene_type:complete
MAEMLKHSNVKERLKRLREISGKVEHLRRFHSDFENKEFLKWTPITHEDINYDRLILFQKAGYVTQLVDWCNTHCQDHYVAYQGKFYFKNENDAAYFTMYWK